MTESNERETYRRGMRRRLPVLAGAVAVALAVGAAAAGSAVAGPGAGRVAAGPGTYDRADLQRDLDAIRGAGATGALAEVSAGGQQLLGRTGVADVRTRTPVPERGYFRMGSNTKTFISVVMLQLVAERRLALDDTVARWLPGVVAGNGNDGRRITVGQLLQHTSGIYNYTGDLDGVFGTADAFARHRFDHFSPQQLVAIAMRHRPLFAPGTGWSYSNTNYVLAGMIIKSVTGHDWRQEVAARILRPLRLTHTFAPGDRPGLPHPHAQGYQQFAPGGPLVDVTVENYSWADAAGELITTAADLTRFWQALQRGELLPPAQLGQMHHTVPAPELQALIPGARYGLGVFWVALSCGSGYWAHYGDTNGYNTADAVSPDGRRSVVVSVSTELATTAAYTETIDLLDHAMCATG